MSDIQTAVPVVSIVGRGGSGKTTFLEKLIAELARRGVRVATVKHHPHEYDIDVPGKDSWRHAQAGAAVVMISSPEKFSVVERVEREKTFAEMAQVALTGGAQIVLTEGYKREGINRIEVARAQSDEELLTAAEDLVALVTDMPEAAPAGVATFGLDDAAGVADLVQSRFLDGVL